MLQDRVRPSALRVALSSLVLAFPLQVAAPGWFVRCDAGGNGGTLLHVRR